MDAGLADCRRGNCLTCTGRHAKGSAEKSLHPNQDDGLSPELSEQVERQGYVLTCSSTVVGDGLKLELGENYEVWNEIYAARFRSAEVQQIGRDAVAKQIRLIDEHDLQRWATKTENALRNSGEKRDDVDVDDGDL